MKKKIVAIMMMMTVLSVSLTACGGDKKEVADNNETVTEEKDETPEESEEATEKESDSDKKNDGYTPDPDLPGVVDVNLTKVQYCIDAPSANIHNNGALLVNASDRDYFVIYDQYLEGSSVNLFEVDLTKITEPSNVIEGMEKQVIKQIADPLSQYPEGYSFELTKKEDVTINGYDMSRFEGTFYLDYSSADPEEVKEAGLYTSTNFVGYSMIKDGCPIYFAVVDRPDEGGIYDCGPLADKIAKTMRERPEE